MKKIILVDKPVGISTFDIIRIFKKHPNFKWKVGHGGTLDVFASGLVLVLVGEETKRFDSLLKLEKEYIANIRLGISSDTLDIEGKLEFSNLEIDVPIYTKIQDTCLNFIGEIEQEVPKFSAAKVNGKPMYKLAREGKEMVKKYKKITIYSIKILGYKFPLLSMKINCSSGTYIRQLTYDILRKIGIESFLFGLTRTKIGKYSIKDAIKLEDIKDLTF